MVVEAVRCMIAQAPSKSSAGTGEQTVENLAVSADHQRHVSVLGAQLCLRARDMSGEPLTVGERYEPILFPLPDRHWSADGVELESPVVDDREVVVEPSPNPARQDTAGGVGELLGERPRQHSAVDLREQVAELGMEVAAVCAGEGRSVLLEVLAQLLAARRRPPPPP